MKTFLTYLIVCCYSLVLQAQQTKGLTPVASKSEQVTSTKRAVVVGISDYQNEDIPDLQFAHKDAELFAEYLLNANNGVPSKEHVKLLLNEQATAGQFISALYWLLEESENGDEAVIYFSGHGDVESTLMSQPGFLLCWDAPDKVYMGGGTLGLAYLKEIVSTMSLKKDIKVTIITDACRSGALAGEEAGGAQATASYLSQQFAKETKIMSCQPNEFALESQEWGGGRGVFSYYLLSGLKGKADNNDDSQVSLKEIHRYLEDKVSEAVAPHNQNPMTLGDRTTLLSVYDKESKAEEIMASTLAIADARNVFANDLALQDTSIVGLVDAFNKALDAKRLLEPDDSSAWSYLKEMESKEELAAFMGLYKRNLSAALQDEAQQSINAYLSGSTNELSKRWTFETGYKDYPEYLSKGAELLGEEHFYYEPLMARYLYFKGVEMRLQGEKDYDTLKIKESIIYQDSCLQYDTLAAFAMNEKAWAQDLIGDYEASVQNFKNTLKLTPKWQLVWSNLCGTYMRQKRYEESIEAGEKAIEIDSSFTLAYYNLCITYKKMDNQEKRKYYLNKAYQTDSTFSSVLNELGYIDFNEKNYESAKNYWLRSYAVDSISVLVNNNLGHVNLKLGELAEAKFHFQNIKDHRPNAIEAFQGMIEYYFYSGDMDNAQKELESYVVSFPKDGFAHYLISSIDASKGSTERSLKNLETAFQNGFDQIETLKADPNFSTIVGTEDFNSLISRYFPD